MNVELEDTGRGHALVIEKGLAVYIQHVGGYVRTEDIKGLKKHTYDSLSPKYPALLPGWLPVAKIKVKCGPGKVNVARAKELARHKATRISSYHFNDFPGKSF